jgi:hypothetical protein
VDSCSNVRMASNREAFDRLIRASAAIDPSQRLVRERAGQVLITEPNRSWTTSQSGTMGDSQICQQGVNPFRVTYDSPSGCSSPW